MVTYEGTQFVGPSVKNVTLNVNVIQVKLIGGKNIKVFYLEGAKYSIHVVDFPTIQSKTLCILLQGRCDFFDTFLAFVNIGEVNIVFI